MTSERNTFRYVVGIIAVLGGLAGLGGLYAFEVPEGNREALLLALGIVLGWGGSVINGEWGSSPAGREAAKVGMRHGSDAPIKTEIVNSPDRPANVEDVSDGR